MPKKASASDEIKQAFGVHSRGDFYEIVDDRDNVLFWCPGKKEGDGRMPSVISIGSYSFPKEDQKGAKPGTVLKEYFNCSKTRDKKPCYCHDTLIAKAAEDSRKRRFINQIVGSQQGGAYYKTFINVADVTNDFTVSVMRLTSGLAKRVGTANHEWEQQTGNSLCDWVHGTVWGFHRVETDNGPRYFQLPYDASERSPQQGCALMSDEYGVGIKAAARRVEVDISISEIASQLADLRALKDVQPATKKWLDDVLAPFLEVSTKTQVQNPKGKMKPRGSEEEEAEEEEEEEGGEEEEAEEEAPPKKPSSKPSSKPAPKPSSSKKKPAQEEEEEEEEEEAEEEEGEEGEEGEEEAEEEGSEEEEGGAEEEEAEEDPPPKKKPASKPASSKKKPAQEEEAEEEEGEEEGGEEEEESESGEGEEQEFESNPPPKKPASSKKKPAQEEEEGGEEDVAEKPMLKEDELDALLNKQTEQAKANVAESKKKNKTKKK